MTSIGSKIQIVDNSGVRLIRCIKVLGSKPRVRARVGNIVVGAVLRALPNRKVRRHDVCKCMIIRMRFPTLRKNGVGVSFRFTAAVVIDARKQPVGNRIKGSSMHELRKRRNMKILALSSSVI